MNRTLLYLLVALLAVIACKAPQKLEKATPVNVGDESSPSTSTSDTQPSEKAQNPTPVFQAPTLVQSGVATYKISTSFINNYRPTQADINGLEYQKKVSFNPRLAKADYKKNTRYYDLGNATEQIMRYRLGKKYLVEGGGKTYKVERTNEVKAVGGYSCQKMIGKATDGTEAEVYYTTAIDAKYNPVFPTEGFTVMYVLKSGNRRSTYTLEHLDAGKVADEALALKGYEKMSQKEFEAGAFKGPIIGFMKGQKALDFERVDLAGQKVSPSAMSGKVVVMNFWFAACSPCKEEVPEFIKLKERYKDKEVEFVAVTYDSPSVAKGFADKTGFDFRIVPSSRDIMDAYKILIYPTTVIVDKNGVVQSIIEKPTNQWEVGREVDKLLN